MNKIAADLAERFSNHWRSLRRDGAIMPTLKNYLDRVDPIVQPWTSILDDIDLITQRWRLIGTNVCHTLGMDLTGKNLLSHVEEKQRKLIYSANHSVCVHPCGQYRATEAITQQGSPLMVETTCFPCSDEQGVARHIVAVHVMDGKLLSGEHISPQLKIHNAHWIDIGAGTPSSP